MGNGIVTDGKSTEFERSGEVSHRDSGSEHRDGGDSGSKPDLPERVDQGPDRGIPKDPEPKDAPTVVPEAVHAVPAEAVHKEEGQPTLPVAEAPIAQGGKILASLPKGSSEPVVPPSVPSPTAGVNIPLILGGVVILLGVGYAIYKQFPQLLGH